MAGRVLVIGIVALAMAGCASVPLADTATDAALKTFSTPSQAAGVYIYRNELRGPQLTTNVDLDGAAFGQLGALTYLHAMVEPGKHSVAVHAENTDTLEFDAEIGKNYYIWQEITFGWFAPRAKLHLVSEAEGEEGVKSTRLASPTYRAEDQSGAKAATTAGAIGVSLLSVFLSIIAGIAALAP